MKNAVAQADLRETEERYRCLVEYAPVGIYVHDGTTIKLANRAFVAMLRASRLDQVIGRSVIEIVHPDDRAVVSSRIQRLREGPESNPVFSGRIVRLDGETADVEVMATRCLYGGERAIPAPRPAFAWALASSMLSRRGPRRARRCSAPDGHLMAVAHVDLYQGDGAAGLRRVEQDWPKIKKSLLMVQITRVENFHLRGRCAVATNNQKLARWCIRKLASEGASYAVAMSALVAAGAAAVAGDEESAVSHFRGAQAAAREADMALLRVVAQRHQGTLIGGDVGETMVDEADAWMQGQAIVNPERFAAMLCPGVTL